MYKCIEKKIKCLDWMVKKKKYKHKNKMLYSKIHKKISLGEYSSLRKENKKKRKPFQSR